MEPPPSGEAERFENVRSVRVGLLSLRVFIPPPTSMAGRVDRARALNEDQVAVVSDRHADFAMGEFPHDCESRPRRLGDTPGIDDPTMDRPLGRDPRQRWNQVSFRTSRGCRRPWMPRILEC